MPKQEDNINTSKEIQDKGDRKTHKWSVWSQGPDNAKETTRKFKQTTPGQVRDYKHFVNKRRFQRFEQVESVQPKNEDAPANSVAGGGVDMAPNAKGTKVFMKKFRVDGRTKEYREANRRIKERQERIAQRQVQAKLDMFGVHANPFAEETESKKYLDTKEGSIEDAIIKALTNLDNPNDERETLTLPKKDVEVEEGFGKLKDASKNLAKMHKAMGIKKDKTTTKKTAKGGIVQTSTYKKANEEKKSGYLEPDMKKRQANNEKARKDMKKMGTPMKNPHLEQTEIDELSNKTMSSYAQKASASQSDAEKKQDYKTADKRISGKLRATRRQFSNDTNRILKGLKKESKETENGERDAGSDKYTNYTKEMTPGQGITNPDAKKADVRKKKEQAAQQQQLNVDEDMKYLNTKEGSIEEAILKALMPERFQKKHEKGEVHDEEPEKNSKKLDKVDKDELKGKHKDRDDKDLDNDGDSDESDRYLHKRRKAISKKMDKEDAKEEVETEAFANPPSGMKFPTKGVKNMGGPKPRQLKDPKKEKMVGTKTGTKVVNRNDPKYKNAPEHESVQSPWISAAVAHLDKVAEKTIDGVKVKQLKPGKETKDVQNALKDKDSIVRQQARQKFGYKTEEKTIMDESDKDGYYAMVDAKNKAKKAGKDWRTMGQGARDAASGAEMIRRGYKKQSNGWVKK